MAAQQTSSPETMTIRALLVDLSGTLHIGKEPTPGALEAFKKLQKANIPFRLASNTTKENKQDLLARLDSIGFEGIDPQDVFTSLSAAATLVSHRKLK